MPGKGVRSLSLPRGCRMGLLNLELSLAAWALITLAALLAAALGKAGLGVLRAYYILRVRAGEEKACSLSASNGCGVADLYEVPLKRPPKCACYESRVP